HQRYGRPPLLSKRQKLRGKVAHHIAVERCKVRVPKAVERREQQQRVFGRLPLRFSLIDQQTCPLRSRLGFRGAVSFDMHQRGNERDLQLDLLTTQRRRGGECCDLIESAGELSCGLNER